MLENLTYVILKVGHSAKIGQLNEASIDTSLEKLLRKKPLGLGRTQRACAAGEGSMTTAGTKGIGVIGKSCALLGLAVDAEVCKRFPEGIYLLVFSQGVTIQGVMKQLARITIQGRKKRDKKK